MRVSLIFLVIIATLIVGLIVIPVKVMEVNSRIVEDSINLFENLDENKTVNHEQKTKIKESADKIIEDMGSIRKYNTINLLVGIILGGSIVALFWTLIECNYSSYNSGGSFR